MFKKRSIYLIRATIIPEIVKMIADKYGLFGLYMDEKAEIKEKRYG